MRVLVCGGRDFGKMPKWVRFGSFDWSHCWAIAEQEKRLLATTLDEYRANGLTLLIHGCASGADDLASRWATDRGVPERGFPAPWKDIDHPEAIVRTLPGGRKYDANAGPRRNSQMLVEGKPDLVLAFAGNKGTADMIRKAEAAGISVVRASSPALPDGETGR